MRILKVLVAMAACWCVALASAAPMDEYEGMEKAAKAGDYQAQRNLAYWLSGGYNGAPPLNAILACAWRIVILESGNSRVDASDVSNKQYYCGDKKLNADGLKAAQAQAKVLQKSGERAR